MDDQADGDGNITLPADLGATCNCTWGELKERGWTCPSGCAVQCSPEDQKPAESGGASVCGPWALSYGFFTGVSAKNGDPDYAKDLIIDVLDISVDDAASRIGNYISGLELREGILRRAFDAFGGEEL